MAITDHPLFRLVDTPGPDVAHGACYFSGDTGPGVDTGILVEFEGTLFFSLNTVREMAEVAGFRVNEEGIELERQVAELAHNCAEYTRMIGELQEQLDDANRVIGAAVAHVKPQPVTNKLGLQASPQAKPKAPKPKVPAK